MATSVCFSMSESVSGCWRTSLFTVGISQSSMVFEAMVSEESMESSLPFRTLAKPRFGRSKTQLRCSHFGNIWSHPVVFFALFLHSYVIMSFQIQSCSEAANFILQFCPCTVWLQYAAALFHRQWFASVAGDQNTYIASERNMLKKHWLCGWLKSNWFKLLSTVVCCLGFLLLPWS